VIARLWAQVKDAYGDRRRHYHTFDHLENILSELSEVKDKIKSWDSVLFALFYHDLVYDIHSRRNEENSAAAARQVMEEVGLPGDMVLLVLAHIHATKKHEWHANSDINYFTDADISVLGGSWTQYRRYLEQLRREYGEFSDKEFSSGRITEMERFLAMEKIYKTEHFYRRYEKQARENIRTELEQYNVRG
jgi:predicted metal-dependent HD superfamily phosphohydrolase